MRKLLILGLWLAALPVQAHSLDELQADLLKQEPHVVFETGIGKPFPQFWLADAEGHPLDLEALRGRVVVLEFITDACGAPCDAQSRLMAEAQQDMAAAHMASLVQFISVTLDPAVDTPELRQGYGKAHGLTGDNWAFGAPADPKTAQDLARQAGLTLLEKPGAGISNPPVTFAIDRNGWLRARFLGLKYDPLNLVTYVNALTNDFHDVDQRQHPHRHPAKPGS